MFSKLITLIPCVAIVLSACGGGSSTSEPTSTINKEIGNPTTTLPVTPLYYVNIEEHNESCPNSGIEVMIGRDNNSSQTLDESEITETLVACHGDDNSQAILDIISIEGDNACTNGKLLRVNVGKDSNANGSLDANEVESNVEWCDLENTGTFYLQQFVTIDEGESLTSKLVNSGINESSLSVFASPTHGALVINEDRTYTYTPESEFYGSDSFTLLEINDDSISAFHRITVAVMPLNNAPGPAEQTFFVYRTSSVTKSIAANDSGVMTFSLITPTEHGELTLETDGIFHYTPTGDYIGGDSFTYQVSHSDGAVNEGVVNLQINDTALVLEPMTIPAINIEQDSAATQRITLRNIGDQGISTRIVSDSDWFGVSSAELYIAPQSYHDITVRYDATLLALGTYSGYLSIESFEQGNPKIEVPVTARVTPINAAFIVTPAYLDAVVVERNFAETQTLTLENIGSTQLSYELTITSVDDEGVSIAGNSQQTHVYRSVPKGQTDDRVGDIVNFGYGGPDDYGYRWKDSRAENGPAFDWMDISETGEVIQGIGDDTVSGPLPIGFDFTFYGEEYSSFYLSSNGFITFSAETHSGCCSGQPIPIDEGVNNIIAWLWDDLHPQQGRVYYQAVNNRQLIIQFENYGEYAGSGTVNAQVILFANGNIKLQYQRFTNQLESKPHSIGIENAYASDGLQIAFNTAFVEDELAVLISPSSTVGWVFADSVMGTISAGEQQEVTLTYLATNEVGDYAANLTISNDDPESPLISMPLQLRVTEDFTPPGTINDLQVIDTSFDGGVLQWTTPADPGVINLTLDRYEIRYAHEAINSQNWQSSEILSNIPAPKAPGNVATFRVEGLAEETEYFFAIRGFDANNNMSAVSNSVEINTLSAPAASLSTDGIYITLPEGQQESVELTLSNDGGSPLNYVLLVEEADASPSSFAKVQQRKTTQHNIAPKQKIINALPAESDYIAGELLVKVNTKTELTALESLRASYQAHKVKSFKSLNIEIWKLADHDVMLSTIQSLNADPRIAYAEPNYTFKTDLLTDDARLPELWGLHNLGGPGQTEDADIDAPEAWEITTGSNEVVVAVIDTGIDYSHPDLAANIWTNSGEIPDNGVDDDNNGFVDDIHGYDFVNGDGDPMDDNNHGTHVAGTIGAEGNNEIGVVGVNHRVRLMGVKFLSGFGGGSTANAIESILYSVDNGAHILNNSWGGGGHSSALEEAIEYARENDVLFIAAAGNGATDNDSFPSYPASYANENIIAVAATDANDQLASFSQFGANSVDLAAPGVDTLSTVPGDRYEAFSGTSMATPHVAGVAALLKARSPNASAEDIKQAILEGVDVLPGLNNVTLTGGRLNAYKAIIALGPQWVQIGNARSGAIAAGESASINLTFDSTDIEVGEHFVYLQVSTNDPENPTLMVPIRLTVTPDPMPPSTIEDLVVSVPDDTSITLNFTAPGDDGDIGKASQYAIAYSSDFITEDNWHQATILDDLTVPNTSGYQETVTLRGLSPNQTYWLAVRAVDNSGQISGLSNVVGITTPYALMSLTPDSLPTITLSQGSAQEITFVIENEGQAPLNVNASTRQEPQESDSFQELIDRSMYFAKGEIDTRQGEPVLQGSGGPDAFGYSWKDSNEVGGPVFEWVDISESGTLLSGFRDDSVVGPIDLGTNFNFYGEDYNAIYVSSNGFISFDQIYSSGCCSGQPIPSSDRFNNIIAWLWYDLHPRSGTVHYALLEDDTFILQFSNYGEFANTGTIDAQIILRAGGDITLQYRNINGMSVNRASIGIENQAGDDGLSVAFNTDYVEEELAIRFNRQPQWITLNDARFSLTSGESKALIMTLDATELSPGDYDGSVSFYSNDLQQPNVTIPITLEVIE